MEPESSLFLIWALVGRILKLQVKVALFLIWALDGRILKLQVKAALFLIWELDGRILKLQVKVDLAVEERAPCTNWIWDWLGPRASMETLPLPGIKQPFLGLPPVA